MKVFFNNIGFKLHFSSSIQAHSNANPLPGQADKVIGEKLINENCTLLWLEFEDNALINNIVAVYGDFQKTMIALHLIQAKIIVIQLGVRPTILNVTS